MPNDPLELARDVLPRWMGWLPLALVPGIFATAVIVTFAFVRLSRAPSESPWTERARTAWPIRLWLALFAVIFAAMGGGLAGVLAPPLTVVPITLLGTLAALAGFVGSDLARLAFERTLHRRVIPRLGWWWFKVKLGVVRFPHLVVAGLWVLFLPRHRPLDPLVVICVALSILLTATGVSWMVLRALGMARDPEPRVANAITRASARTKITPRDVMVLPTHGVAFANAFALPVLGRLVFTEEAVRVLDDDQIEAVAAHELGHVGEPKSIAWLRTLGSLPLIPLALLRPLHHAYGPWVGPLAILGCAVLVRLSLIGLLRRMEERADAIAGHEHGHVYAKALEAIHRANMVPAVMRAKKAVHPDLWDRMIAAGVTPEGQRPQPPATRNATILAVVLVLVAYVPLSIGVVWCDQSRTERMSWLVGEAAWEAAVAGDREKGAALYDAASMLTPNDPWPHVNRGLVVAQLGRCEEAEGEAELAALLRKRDPRVDEAIERVRDAIEQCKNDQAINVP